MIFRVISRVVVHLSLLLAVSSCGRDQHQEHGHGHGHGHGHDEEHEEASKGPQGGRLFSEGNFELELLIFERNTPPKFRVYAYQDEKALDPKNVSISMELTRLGNKKAQITFVAGEKYLESIEVISEPHSFQVELLAQHASKKYSWNYESFEARTTISDEAINANAIRSEKIGPKSILTKIAVNGQLGLNEDKLVHVIPRFPGVAKVIRKKLGDSVEKNEVLAVIESNHNLQPYEIRSQIKGTVIKRHLASGEFAGEGQEIFMIADLSELWADFRIYREDFNKVEVGQKVLLFIGKQGPPVESKIIYISPFGEEATQSKIVRAIIPNTNAQLYPALFVKAEIVVEERKVALAIKDSALQNFYNSSAALVQVGNIFEVRPLELGISDGEYHEVISGLDLGDLYVSNNSYTVKADILKSGATHDH